MEKYIFLDIDGVLVTMMPVCNKTNEEYLCSNFDPKCIKVFNEIINTINPTIIISSDWKLHYSIEILRKIFLNFNINCNICDITESLWGKQFISLNDLEECRAMEILKYVEEHKIINWLAIDDLNLNKWISNNFVHCKFSREGIAQTGIKDKIIKYFNKTDIMKTNNMK